MKSRRVLLVFAAAAAAVSLIGSVVATQYCAAKLGYQRALGSPTSILSLRVFSPWSWMQWDSDFGPYAPAVFKIVRTIGWCSLLGTWVPLIVFALILSKRRDGSTAHGSARWGDRQDLRAAGLLSANGGVVLCQTNDARYIASDNGKERVWRMTRPGRLITHDGPEHVITFAPTRSGKGIGTVVPTLLSWKASALVYDIKKELWSLTAGWRRRFSRCWRFEPTATDSIRFNPLLEVRPGDTEVRDVQNIADILVDPDGSSEKRDHWKLSAHTLLTGAILHVLYAERDKSLTGVARLLSNPALPIQDTLQRMLVTRHLPTGAHPVVAQCARAMLNKSENELSGIVSTAMTCVDLYVDPLIARNTSTSDFRIDDLMNADDPVSLYLVVPPSDLVRTRPLIRLMLNQIGSRLTERMNFDKPAYKHRLLLLLDEFPSLGKLSFLETQLAFLAGYGVKAYLIAQSLNQLQSAYGAHNSILDNCHIRMTYTATDDQTAKRVSNLVGQATHTKLQRSFSGGGWFRKVNQSEQEHARPLLTPDEILRLPFDDALLFVGGVAPYRARKLMYYLDPRFKDRVKLPTPDSERQRRHELLPTRQASPWEQILPPPAPPPLTVACGDGGGGREPARPGHDVASPSALPSASTARSVEPEHFPMSANMFAELFGNDAPPGGPTAAPGPLPGSDAPTDEGADGPGDLPL